MRYRLLRAAALLVLVAAAGCAQLPGVERLGAEERVAHWVQEGEYGKAWELLQQLPETALPEQRERLSALIAEYDRQAIAEARQRYEQDDWAGALDLLEAAQGRLPAGSESHGHYVELQGQLAHRAEELRERLLIVRSEALLLALPLLEDLARLEADRAAAYGELEHSRTELAAMAAQLVACGRAALEAGRLDRAERCLQLAARVEQAPEVMQMLAELEKVRSAQQQRARAQRERTAAETRRREAEALLAEARELIQQARLADARETLAHLLASDVPTPEVAELHEALSAAISAKVDELLERGNTLYRRERIEEAREVWRSALQIDPGNPRVRSNIDRADRVLERVRQLQQQAQPQ
jgi:hypothetical protein